MDITQDNLDSLRVSFSTAFQSGYESVEPYSAPFYNVIPSNGFTGRYGWLAQQAVMREWIGERVFQNLSEHEYSLDNRDFESSIEVDRNQIADDMLGIFQGVHFPQLGVAAKYWDDQLFEELMRMNSGAGPTAFDGKALFANDHPTYAPATDPITGAANVTTYDNLDSLAFSATNLRTVYNKAKIVRGENGRTLRINPTHLLHAPQLKFEVQQVLSSATYAQAVAGDPGTGSTVATEGRGAVPVDNPMRGLLIPVECPGLSDNGTFWAIADFSKPLKPFVKQLREAPYFAAQDQITNEQAFLRKKFRYGTAARGAMGVTLPFLIWRGNAI